MGRKGRIWRTAGAAALAALVVTACAGDENASDTEDSPSPAAATSAPGDETSATDEGPASESADDWNAVVAAAEDEGTVTLYSSSSPASLERLKTAFEEEYEITLQIVRDVDAPLAQRAEQEHLSGNVTADVFINATPQVTKAHAEEGWITPPVGPAFDEGDYAESFLYDEGYWEVMAFVSAIGWNTELVDTDITGYEDLLNPAFEEQIGVIEPTSPSIVDFYVFLEKQFGEDYVEELGALNPRIYSGATPITEAMAAGEISVAAYSSPARLQQLQEEGAPLEMLIPDPAWGAHFYGEILEAAPNPNAAQVLANFLVTPEGQEAIAYQYASALPGIEGALADLSTVSYLDEELLTPEFVREYETKWRSWYQ